MGEDVEGQWGPWTRAVAHGTVLLLEAKEGGASGGPTREAEREAIAWARNMHIEVDRALALALALTPAAAVAVALALFLA